MSESMQGRRVLVTGGSAGIGAALAEGLAERGAIVGICGRNEQRLSEVEGRLQSVSPESRAWQVDLAELDGLEKFARRVVDDLGGLDVLVNNAGIPKRRWAWDHRADEVADVLRINVESPIRLTQLLLDDLERSNGAVVFIGSVAARRTPPAEAVYAASKAAVTAYAECLRVDLGVARRAVGVHVIQPGVLDTDLFTHADNDPPISDIEPIAPDSIVEPVLDALATGRFETYVPDFFVDIPPVKVGDVDGFLEGSIEYTRGRLSELGRSFDQEDPS